MTRSDSRVTLLRGADSSASREGQTRQTREPGNLNPIWWRLAKTVLYASPN